MLRKLIVVVACSAVIPLLTATAGAEGIRVNQRFAGATLSLDEFFQDTIFTLKGGPGSGRHRGLTEFGPLGPPSERCEGFDIEVSLVQGTFVQTYADLSNLIGRFTDGFACGTFAGEVKSQLEGVYEGGTRRFEGASGTFLIEIEGRALQFLAPRQTSWSGTITGTINLDN